MTLERQLGRPKKPYRTRSVRVAEDVARMIHGVAGMKGVDAVDWLSELLRPVLQKQMEKAQEELKAKQKKEGQ